MNIIAKTERIMARLLQLIILFVIMNCDHNTSDTPNEIEGKWVRVDVTSNERRSDYFHPKHYEYYDAEIIEYNNYNFIKYSRHDSINNFISPQIYSVRNDTLIHHYSNGSNNMYNVSVKGTSLFLKELSKRYNAVTYEYERYDQPFIPTSWFEGLKFDQYENQELSEDYDVFDLNKRYYRTLHFIDYNHVDEDYFKINLDRDTSYEIVFRDIRAHIQIIDIEQDIIVFEERKENLLPPHDYVDQLYSHFQFTSPESKTYLIRFKASFWWATGWYMFEVREASFNK
jgi:hypothetical protein